MTEGWWFTIKTKIPKLYSEQVLWKNGEKILTKNWKILKFNANDSWCGIISTYLLHNVLASLLK